MTKVLSPKVHGYLDFVLVAAFALAPSLFGFSDIAATICYIIAATQLTMSLLTKYPMGIVKWIPFPVHGSFELVASIGLFVIPHVFGFADDTNALWFFRATGLLVLGVWTTTDYKAAVGYQSNRTGYLKSA